MLSSALPSCLCRDPAGCCLPAQTACPVTPWYLIRPRHVLHAHCAPASLVTIFFAAMVIVWLASLLPGCEQMACSEPSLPGEAGPSNCPTLASQCSCALCVQGYHLQSPGSPQASASHFGHLKQASGHLPTM